MSITSIDISALYITMFNRVPEGAGHKFWFNLAKKQGLNTSQVAQQMLNSAPAQEYFAGKNSNEDFVNHIYSNLFGKTIAQDPKGSKFWIDKLKEGNSKAFVVSEMLKAAMSNTYTKPEELKAQKLFLNKLKAAEIAHKAIENVPSSGSITEKIASFANILKNIKDTSTPTQIAQVIKQEALKGNLKILSNKELAQITKSIFPSVDADALQKALDNTTATTDIYEEGGSTPTPPTPPAPTPNPGGSGGSNNPKPLTPEEQKQKEKEEAVKQAEENLQKAKEAAKQAQTDKLVADAVKDAVKDSVENHGGVKQDALNHIQNKIDDPSTTNEQREALEKAKDIVNTFGRTLDDKKLTEVTGEAEIADKTKDVAGKQEKVAEKQVDHAKAVAKEAPLFNTAQKAYDDKAKAESEKAVADALKGWIDGAGNIVTVEIAIEASVALTHQQKLAAKAQLDAWVKELNLNLLDSVNEALKDKANENKQAAQDKFDKAVKAYNDGGNAGAQPDYDKNKKTIEDSVKDIEKAKADVATAVVVLRKAQEEAAKANLDKDPGNQELKEILEKAKTELKKAEAEEKAAKITVKTIELNALELKKVGDTNVYKSKDGKYTVDLGADNVTDGKTLVVNKADNKLHEIDENSADLGASVHTTKPLLKSNDKGGTIYKDGAEQFSFISKDGNAVAALKGDNQGFILKPGVKSDYDTMSKAEFDYAIGKFEANGAEQQAHKIETEKTVLPHNMDNPQFRIAKIKTFDGANDYEFKDKPILNNSFDFTIKDMNGIVKIPLINGKIYAGTIDGYNIYTDANNNLKNIIKEGFAYNFDADEKVESITVGGVFTFTLKDGHKALNEAVALAADDDALNKATSIVFHKVKEHIYKLDNDGNLKQIQLKNGAELTVKGSNQFKPDNNILDELKIEKIKFADDAEAFELTGDHKFEDVQKYEKVVGKFLLKSGEKYINSVYEDGTHKFTVTDVGVDKYTLTKTKSGNTVSVEKLEGGITKIVDANGVKLAGTEDNNGDTVTITATETTLVAPGTSKEIGVQNLNAGKVSFNSVEKIVVNSAQALDAKGLSVLNEAANEITLGNDLTLNNANGGNIDLGKVKDGGHNLTVDVTGNAKADTLKFGANVAGDRLNINGFDQGKDKVDFSALGATEKSVNKVVSNAEQGVENGKIYTTEVADAITGKNYGGADFAELFADSGKAFKTAAAAAGKSIIVVKGNDVTKIYQVDNVEGAGADTIDAGEVNLVGTFNSGVALENANIA